MSSVLESSEVEEIIAALKPSIDFADKSVLLVANTDDEQQFTSKLPTSAHIELVDKLNLNNLGQNKYDLIFANTILTSLKDDGEIDSVIGNFLNALKVDSLVFLRELCSYTTSEDTQSQNRSPTKYIDYLQSKFVQVDGNNLKFGFELTVARPTRCLTAASNADYESRPFYFIFRKKQLDNFHGFNTFREFLDHKQYSVNGTLQYEMIFGSGFISPGGADSTAEFIERLDLKPGQRVLDVGCGIGGAEFMMAQKYNVDVCGLDLSSNVICIALSRLKDYSKDLRVNFEIGDATSHVFPTEYFDAIYSRDVILHIADKRALFDRLRGWLKPGGRLFITDYCCGPKDLWSDEFTAYVAQRGYTLLTPDDYGQTLRDVGFVNVKADDCTDKFVGYLNDELVKFAAIKEKFVKAYSVEDYDHLVESWNEKIGRCEQGHHRWGIFDAQK